MPDTEEKAEEKVQEEEESKVCEDEQLDAETKEAEEAVNEGTNQKELLLRKQKDDIRRAFDMFDKEQRGCVIPEEISTIMRYLGHFPTEKDIIESILPDIQDEEEVNFVYYDRFEPKMLECMKSGEYLPDDEDVLLSAFQVLDPERKGYIEADRMREVLCKMGTPFREKEIESFLNVSKDVEAGRIYYGDYVSLLTHDIEQAKKVAYA